MDSVHSLKPFRTSSLDIFNDISGIVSGGSSHGSSGSIAAGSSADSESLTSSWSMGGAKRSVMISLIHL